MIYHILNGDSLAHSFPAAKIPGETVVVREALIDGDLSGEGLNEFWRTRARYIGVTEAEYKNSIEREFRKIIEAPATSEFNLWFEYDLFCQVNMWFVISLINNLAIDKKVFAVYTSYMDKTDKRFWNGFGPADADELKGCYANRTPLSEADLRTGHDLWKAYKMGTLDELMRLSELQSAAFPHLKEVIKAHVERFPKDGTQGRPERVLEDIIKNISADFDKVINEFWKRESIYGFGDSQIKKLYDEVLRRPK